MHRQYFPYEYHDGNIDDYGTVRPMTNINFNGNYFLEGFIGADHEIKFGVDYVRSTVSTFDLFEGFLETVDVAPDWTEAWLHRDYYINESFNRYSAFAQDTLTFGRLSINLGLRYDIEVSKVASEVQPATPFLPQYLGEKKITSLDPGVKSKILSPRLSLIYDIFGNGKDVLKLNLARYGGQSGYEFASFVNPVGWTDRPPLGRQQRRRPRHEQRALRDRSRHAGPHA